MSLQIELRLAAIFVAALSTAVSLRGEEVSPPLRAAVVQVGGCSGVCVDAAGLILTAKHCDLGEVERIRFAGYEVLAVRVYEAPETEGPVVYDCVGGGYPFADVAGQKPEPGDPVTTMGYPVVAGGRRLHEASGEVQRGGLHRFRNGTFPGNLTNLPLSGGWSGGPLFNLQGEVVGLATSSDGRDSIFISHTATRTAYERGLLLHSEKPILEVALDLENDDCLRFLSDYSQDKFLRGELQEHFQLVVVDASQAAERLPEEAVLPVFFIGNALAASGYNGKASLLQRLTPRASPEAPR